MNWFGKLLLAHIKEPLTPEEVDHLINSKLEKLLKKLPEGYNLEKTEKGWVIRGPEGILIAEEPTATRAIRMAIPRLRYMELVAKSKIKIR